MKSSIRRLLNQGKPPVPYSPNPSRSLSFSLKGGQSGMESYLNTYISSGTVRAIVDTMTTATAMPEWGLYKKQQQDNRVRYTTADKGSDQRIQVIQHAALMLWNNPNPFQTRFEFVEGFMQHYELCGEAWWVLARDGTSFPTSMWFVRPDRMEPVPSPENYLQGYIYHAPGGEIVPLNLNEVICIRTPNPLDQFRGAGPVSSIMPNIEAMRYATEWERNFFLNGAEPGGVIQVDRRLSDSEWDEFTNRWRESHAGVVRAHRVAVLENNAVWVPNVHTTKDMDFANLRNVSRDELREAWGIHKSMIGNADDVNRANAQTAEEVFGTWKIIPRLSRIRCALNDRLLPMFGSTGSGVEFDFDNPLPDDREADNAELMAKAQATQFLIAAGYDPDDVLEVVGLPPMGSVPKPVAGPATQADTSQPPATQDSPQNRIMNKKDVQARVFEQQAQDYPPKAMAWMHHADWSGPVNVPLEHVDPTLMDMEEPDPDHVQDFVKRLEDGKKNKPVILVKTPDSSRLKLIDGHHRFLASAELKQPVRGFIGTVSENHGDWETMHDFQEAKDGGGDYKNQFTDFLAPSWNLWEPANA